MINYNKADFDLKNNLLTYLYNNIDNYTYNRLIFIHINIKKDQILFGHMYGNSELAISNTKLESTFEEGVYYFDKPLDIDLFDTNNLNKYRILYEPKEKNHKNSIVYNKTNNTYKLMNNVYDKLEIDFSEKNLNLIDGL